MKARYVIVMGLAVLATSCSTSLPTVIPPTSTPTTVSPTSTSTTVSTSDNNPPPVPHCYYTGSGYGTCEGYVIPEPGTVVLFTRPDKDGIFKLTGPAPLQTETAVACGDAGCVYNHLDWNSSYGAAVPDEHNCLRRPDPTAYELDARLCASEQQPGTSLPPLELRQAWGDHQRICP